MSTSPKPRQRRRERLIHSGQAADILGISPRTLRTWDGRSGLTVIRTLGGHRRYRPSEVFALRKRLTAEVEHIEAVA